MSNYQAVLLLGSNLGDSKKNLLTAKKLISERVGEVFSGSSIYETAPWGNKDQPSFLNQALKISTVLEPIQLMKTLLQIEKEMGRIREEKWGARLIDIDILLIDDLVLDSLELKIPHPFLPQRRFSLLPLAEIWPEWVHPVLGKNVLELLEVCEDDSEVKKL